MLDIELNDVQNRIMASQSDKQFIFRCTTEAKEFLLREGTDLKYGARHLKRAIERHLVYPMSNLIATGQIGSGRRHQRSILALPAISGVFQRAGFGSGFGFDFPVRRASCWGAAAAG